MHFEICAKMLFQKCMGWGGGVRGHNFEHGAVNGTTHRAQASGKATARCVNLYTDIVAAC